VNSSPQRAAAGDVGDFCWGALAAHVLHPVQVEIIEALRWIDRPLTATDLLQVFGAKRSGLRIEHHLRRLTKIDAMVPDDDARRGPMADRPYRLVRHPKT
jgi:hypothetical protein